MVVPGPEKSNVVVSSKSKLLFSVQTKKRRTRQP